MFNVESAMALVNLPGMARFRCHICSDVLAYPVKLLCCKEPLCFECLNNCRIRYEIFVYVCYKIYFFVCGLSSNPPDLCPYCRQPHGIEELLSAPVAWETINEMGEAMLCNEYTIKLFGLLNERVEEGRRLKISLETIHALIQNLSD